MVLIYAITRVRAALAGSVAGTRVCGIFHVRVPSHVRVRSHARNTNGTAASVQARSRARAIHLQNIN